MAALGFNSSQDCSVPLWISSGPQPLQHPVVLSSTNPSCFPQWQFLLILNFLPSTLLFYTLCWETWKKNVDPASFSLFLMVHRVRAGSFGSQCVSLPFGAQVMSSALAGFLAPSQCPRLSHHPAWCVPERAHTSWVPFHHSSSFPCHSPDSTSFYHSPSYLAPFHHKHHLSFQSLSI